MPQPLNPILLRLRAQLTQAPGAGTLTRADVLDLAELAIERDELRTWTKHLRTCGWEEAPAWRKTCTCGLEQAEERVRAKVAEMRAPVKRG
jgi:hypothetical protein